MRLRIIWVKSLSTAIRACIRSSLILLLCSRLWPDSLSLWETCMLNVRSVVYNSLVYQLSHSRRNDDDSSGSGFQDHSPPLRYFWGARCREKEHGSDLYRS